MFSTALLPNTKRKIVARLPVQNAIGRPSASNIASPPKRRTVSQPIPISRPMRHAPLRITNRMSLISLETPCSSSSAAPIGIASLTGQYWMPHSVNDVSPKPIESDANLMPVTSIVPMKMKKKTDVTMSATALPRGENFA